MEEEYFEFEERMAKRAMLVERVVRYAVGIAVASVVVALFCRIAAKSENKGASDPWMQAIDNARRGRTEGGCRE